MNTHPQRTSKPGINAMNVERNDCVKIDLKGSDCLNLTRRREEQRKSVCRVRIKSGVDLSFWAETVKATSDASDLMLAAYYIVVAGMNS